MKIKQKITKIYRHLLIFILLAFLGLFSTLSIPALSAVNWVQEQTPVNNQQTFISQASDALELEQQGLELYRQGKFAEAIDTWQKAANLFAKNDKEGQIRSLTFISQALQNLGLNWQACNTTLDALDIDGLRCRGIDNEIDNLVQQLKKKIEIFKFQSQSLSINQATTLSRLGDNFRRIGYLEESKKILELSLDLAEYWQDNEEISAVEIDLGNTLRALGNRERNREQEENASNNYKFALKHYKNAIEKARISEDKNILITAQINFLSLSFNSKLKTVSEQEIIQIQSEILTQVNSLPLNWKNLSTKINLVDTLLKQKTIDSKLLTNLKSLLKKTTNDAKEIRERRIEAIAIGYQGKLYQQQASNSQNTIDDLVEAQRLTQQALLILNQVTDRDNRDIYYLLHSQLGSIYQEQNNIEQAIVAYELALQNLQQLRNDLVSVNKNVQFDFKEQVEPIYRRTVDLLIKSADRFPEKAQERLRQARDAIEQLQLAELENFFGEACLTAKPQQINTYDSNTVIIYTIILPDRLEVVVSMSKQTELKENQQEEEIIHYSKVSKQELEVSLYRLLQEYGGNLKSQERDGDGNYLFLPDLEKLYDWIIRPVERKLQNRKSKTLVFILDNQLRNLPMATLYDQKKQEYLIQKYAIALTPGLQLLKSKPLPEVKLKALLGGASFEENEQLETLEYIEIELNEIEGKIGKNNSIKLFETDFTEKNLAREIKNAPFTVVHLATHGNFSSNLKETFIQTHDKRLNANEFSKLFRNRTEVIAIELLVLSACETAKGDSRAGLGLSGIAIRSEVRSTIASLWTIEDKFTASFMIEFYNNLNNNSTLSKAEILRITQLNFIESEKLPKFWAPFVLVGNWE